MTVPERDPAATPPHPTPPPTLPPTPPGPEARQWAMIAHLSALVGLLGNGIGFLLGPLIVWAVTKDRDPYIDEQGKEAINFQLSAILVGAVAIALIFTIVGIVIAIPVLILLGIVMVVFPIVAAVAANEGKPYRYPFAWRFVR